jgi:hypothetical protein
MTNEERAKVNESALRGIVGSIEEIRVELVGHKVIDDEEKAIQVSDKLYELRLQLQEVADIIGCYTD